MSDLISRQALCEYALNQKDKCVTPNDIMRFPPAQPERKKGEWMEIEIMPKAYDIIGVRTWASVMKCDTCGFETFAIEGHMAQYHFCPSCGARMDGESDD